MDQVILKCSETILNTFTKLWQEKDFTDVTLVTCDGEEIKAHRVILCSASKFFRKLLVGKCNENPLIYFKGIFFQELDLLIKLIYLGECQAAEDRLDKLLDLALELEVEVILKEDFENKSKDPEIEQREKDFNSMERNDNLQLKGSIPESQSVFEIQNREESTSSSLPKTDLQRIALDNLERFSCSLCSKGFYYIYQLEEHKKIKHEGKRYKCDLCDKNWPKKKQLISHKEIKHEGVRYDCDDCGFKSVSRKNLKSHRDFIHAGIGVDCDICENKYSTTWAVINHKYKVHGISKQV